MTDMTMVGVRFPVARRRHLALAGRCPPSLWDCLCYIRPVQYRAVQSVLLAQRKVGRAVCSGGSPQSVR